MRGGGIKEKKQSNASACYKAGKGRNITVWTDPEVGNHWHVIVGGACVYAFPVWLYCDDVSGNQSVTV